jgi:hypothetical protein
VPSTVVNTTSTKSAPATNQSTGDASGFVVAR